MSSLVDAYLVFRARTEGDRAAFGRLYDRHVTSLYRFAYSKLSSREAAEDLVSEVFLEFWRALSQGRDDIQSARGFLYMIARRRVIDVYRQNKRRPTERLEVEIVTVEGVPTTTDSEGTLSDRGKGHRQAVMSAEAALLIRHIKKLKEDYQDVLLLRLVEELSFPEIAQALGKSHANVRVVYHRALALLKEFVDRT